MSSFLQRKVSPPHVALLLVSMLFSSCVSAPRAEPSSKPPILELQHHPGMGVGMSLWSKLLSPRLKPSEWWTLRIFENGDVEQFRITCSGEQWRDRRTLRPEELQQLLALVEPIRGGPERRVCCEDVGYNGLVIWEGDERFEYHQEPYSKVSMAGFDENIIGVFSFVKERYGAPRLPICTWL